MPEPRLTLVSQALDEAAMTTLSRAVAGALQAPCTVYLRGSLGAGKTTFTRALIQALGHAGRVKSPTYGLLEHYELAGVNVLHLDLYRIGDPGELDFLGIEDLCDDADPAAGRVAGAGRQRPAPRRSGNCVLARPR